MGKFDHLWNDHWCLDLKSNKKKQMFYETRYKVANSAPSRKDLYVKEYIIQRRYLKTEHVRCFLKEEWFERLKKNFSSRKWLTKNYCIPGYSPYTAKYIDKVPNVFTLEIPPGDNKKKFDFNIDGANKFIQTDFFHIKIIFSKSKTERTFKKVKNISKKKGIIKFKGIEFPSSPYHIYNYAWIFLPGVKISKFTFTQDLGKEINEIGGEIKKFGSEIKSDMKEMFYSLNPFKKKKKK